MKIAIIGYGSLIWDLECLAPHVTGQWQVGTGPSLPVEFSRVSPKRQQALVLVVDENLSHTCPTSIITSRCDNLDEAINDLAARERCKIAKIAAVKRTQSARGTAQQAVSRWLYGSDYDAAIWTALEGNFEDETGIPFCHDEGLEYLKTLSDQARREAWRYITYAPEVTDTPFRQYLAKSPYWQTLDERERSRAS